MNPNDHEAPLLPLYTLGNVLQLLPHDVEKSRNENMELFQTLNKTDSTTIERIISTGQFTPSDDWYDQDRDEFVVLLQGEASLLIEEQDTTFQEVHLGKGDFINLPKHVRHRVTKTSQEPPCIWLAFHYQ